MKSPVAHQHDRHPVSLRCSTCGQPSLHRFCDACARRPDPVNTPTEKRERTARPVNPKRP